MPVKVAVIGASFARAAYLPALAVIEDTETVAVASARLERAQAAAAAFGVPHAYDDWRRMLAEQLPDLVCIATPTVMHAPMTLAAFDVGAHVLCEKPTAMDASEARAMLDAAEGAGKLHMIDHELRFNPNRRKIHRLVTEGALGEIRHVNISNISSTWGDPASRPANDWWSMAEQGGGRLGANGSHQVDLLRWWLGDVKSVSGLTRTLVPDRFGKDTGEPWTATADDVAQFSLEFASGTVAHVFLSGVAGHGMDNATQVFGSDGTILLNNSDERLMFARTGEAFADITEDDPNAELGGIGGGIWNVSVVALLEELVEAIRDESPLHRGATFHDGWRNQLVLDAVRRSSRERRWIDVED